MVEQGVGIVVDLRAQHLGQAGSVWRLALGNSSAM